MRLRVLFKDANDLIVKSLASYFVLDWANIGQFFAVDLTGLRVAERERGIAVLKIPLVGDEQAAPPVRAGRGSECLYGPSHGRVIFKVSIRYSSEGYLECSCLRIHSHFI